MKTIQQSFFFIIISLLILACSSKMSKKQIENIEKNGTETTGVVVKKNYTIKTINNYETKEYFIKFDIDYHGKMLLCNFSLGKDEEAWSKFEIGMRYKVKYLDLGDQTLENSIIYLEFPIEESRSLIDQELERIKSTYEKK